MHAAEIIKDIQAVGATVQAVGDKLIVRPAGRLPEPLRVLIREYKPEILAALAADPVAEQAADLIEHFTERAAILEYDGGLFRHQAEAEAARMTATLARNRGYAWAALRLAFRDCPAILAALPDLTGQVDSLPLGVSRLAIHPRAGVISQGRHHAA